MKNINYFKHLKNKELFSSLVVYDATFASLASKAGIDILVVGDSLGMNIVGRKTTIGTTIKEIIYHSEAVLKGNSDSFIILDMPAFTYSNFNKALKNAGKLMKIGGHMVKIEGGNNWVVNIVEKITARGIPVCGHLGLTPQYYYKMGGHKIQGITAKDKKNILSQALALESAGIEMLVLECIPENLGKIITQKLNIPVFGAGAGRFLDGQVLLAYDILGLTEKKLKFTCNFFSEVSTPFEAFKKFDKMVKEKKFPSDKQIFM